LNFDFSHFDLCFDPVVILDNKDQVIYLNPSFETTYNFSNKKITRFKKKFDSLMTFEGKSLADLQNNIFYHLEFKTSHDKVGIAQVGVDQRDDYKVIFLKDLAFEEHLQSKYKSVLNSLRGNNQKLIKILDDENHHLVLSNEIQNLLHHEESFLIVKTDQDFKFLFSSSSNFEKKYGISMEIQPWVKIFTQGQADKTSELITKLKQLPLHNLHQNEQVFKFEANIGSSQWVVKVIKAKSPPNHCYYFILREGQSALRLVEKQQQPVSHSQGDIYNLINLMSKMIAQDLSETNQKDVRQLLRNYFWQSLLLSLNSGPFEEFNRTHLENPELAKELKLLGRKSLDLALREARNMTASHKTQVNLKPIMEEVLLKNKLSGDLLSDPLLKKLEIEEFAAILGCILYFYSVTKVQLKKFECKKLKQSLELKFNFKFPRDPKPVYEFLKRAHLKSFEIEGDFLTISL
jgi:uncharacterized protein YihD (DUF1040 family)